MKVPRENAFELPEFERRRSLTRERMSAMGLDTLILHSPANIYYLCGHHTLNLWDYQCLVLPLNAEPFMLLWQFEEGRFAATAVGVGVELFGGESDPIEHTRSALERRSLNKGTIGLEKASHYLSANHSEALSKALAPANVVDGTGAVEVVRMVKSAGELDLIRQAARGTDDAVRAALAVIREGARDTEIAAAAMASMVANDTQAFSVYPMVAAGYRSGIPHHSHAGVHIKRGEPVFLEYSPAIHWYHAPLMYSAIVGEPPAFANVMGDTGAAALQAMFDTMRAGVRASDVARAGKAEVDKIRDRIHFHDVFAYSVGIGFPPTWLEDTGFGILMSNDRELEAGMVFHFPMTLRVKGEYGVGQSRTVIVTETGAEVLSELPLGLHRID